jgi:hypothetical protein
MTPWMSKKPGESAPRGPRSADSPAEMDPAGFTFEPSDLRDPRVALEALSHWDELAPERLALLARHPDHGPRLERLQQAEAWLEEGARSARGQGARACPDADELYDHGRGPGYRPLDDARRAEIDRHLLHCLDCELLVASLVRRPPMPLEIEPLVADAWPGDEAGEGLHEAAALAVAPVRPARRRLLRLVPLAAAAALLLGLVLWIGRGAPVAGGLALPQAPLLRGAMQERLLYPRERLLAPPAGESLPAWLELARLRRFETLPVEGATLYRLELFRHDGGAFDEGRRVARHAGPEPAVPMADVGPALEPGHYTWEAWAVVNDLDQRLGARDFEVVADGALWRELEGLLGLEGSDRAAAPRPNERSLARAIRLLDERGFSTDARALARLLPPSPERDAFLERRPGR